jgi:hypothetical protein
MHCLPLWEAVCLIAEEYDQQSTVITLPCSTNPLASSCRDRASPRAAAAAAQLVTTAAPKACGGQRRERGPSAQPYARHDEAEQ